MGNTKHYLEKIFKLVYPVAAAALVFSVLMLVATVIKSCAEYEIHVSRLPKTHIKEDLILAKTENEGIKRDLDRRVDIGSKENEALKYVDTPRTKEDPMYFMGRHFYLVEDSDFEEQLKVDERLQYFCINRHGKYYFPKKNPVTKGVDRKFLEEMSDIFRDDFEDYKNDHSLNGRNKSSPDRMFEVIYLAAFVGAFLLIFQLSTEATIQQKLSAINELQSLKKFRNKANLEDKDTLNLLKYILSNFVYLKYDKDEIHIFDISKKEILIVPLEDMENIKKSSHFDELKFPIMEEGYNKIVSFDGSFYGWNKEKKLFVCSNDSKKEKNEKNEN